jgi:hypothetical protein
MKFIEKSTRLRQKIEVFFEIQHHYIPRLGYLRGLAEQQSDYHEASVYSIPLSLPSSSPPGLKFDAELSKIEFRVRVAEAYDALDALRRHLLLKTSVWQFRNANVFGQRMLTRSQQVINDVMDKINKDARRYRRAYKAITTLAPLVNDFSWKGSLRKLKDSDIRSFRDTKDVDGKGHASKSSLNQRRRNFEPQRRQTYSWIWLSARVSQEASHEGTDKNTLNEGMY